MKFFIFLIKKELMLLQRVVRVVATRVGRSYLQWEKVKTKKWLCTIGKIKTKKLQMKVFEFQT